MNASNRQERTIHSRTDGGEPVTQGADKSAGVSGLAAESGIRVKLDWHEGELVGVRLRGVTPREPDRAVTKVWRVFKVQQSADQIILILDPSSSVGSASLSGDELPDEIRLERSSTARGDIYTHVPDAGGRRGLYELLEERGHYRLTICREAVAAIPTLDETGFVKQIRLRDLNPSAAAKPLVGSLYRAKQGGAATVLSAVDVPPYYIGGVEKKLDIRDHWAAPFDAVVDAILAKRMTLLGHDRLYTLWQAVRNVAHLDTPIVEVGVFRGGSSRLMAEAQRHFGKRGAIYSCDTFSGHAEVDPERDAQHLLGAFGEEVDLADVRHSLEAYPEATIVVGNIMSTAGMIPDGPIAMLHLDVDVYLATKFCLNAFAPRIDPSGIIVVDDYGFTTCPGAKAAVDEFMIGNGSWAMMHLLTGQALLHPINRTPSPPVGA